MGNPLYSKLLSEMQDSDALTRLALGLSWSWNHWADDIWKRLDPELWELTANPWLILQSVSQRRLDSLTDDVFRSRVEQLLEEVRQKNEGPAWFQTAHPFSPLRTVAYFSMEYMLTEALPIYSGGLGNVAGDQLKAASDLGVPIFEIEVYLGGFDPNSVRVELYAEPRNGAPPFLTQIGNRDLV